MVLFAANNAYTSKHWHAVAGKHNHQCMGMSLRRTHMLNMAAASLNHPNNPNELFLKLNSSSFGFVFCVFDCDSHCALKHSFRSTLGWWSQLARAHIRTATCYWQEKQVLQSRLVCARARGSISQLLPTTAPMKLTAHCMGSKTATTYEGKRHTKKKNLLQNRNWLIKEIGILNAI